MKSESIPKKTLIDIVNIVNKGKGRASEYKLSL